MCRLINDYPVRHRHPKPVLPGGYREMEPPDPIPNSEVKRFIADGSVGFPHVRVGHRQALNTMKKAQPFGWAFFIACRKRFDVEDQLPSMIIDGRRELA